MGHGPSYGSQLHLWVRTPLVGRSSTYGSEVRGFIYGAGPHLWVSPWVHLCFPLWAHIHLWGRAMGQSSTYGAELHLWVSPWRVTLWHNIMECRYRAAPHLWVRAPLMGRSSTYGSVRGSSHVLLWAHIHLWGSAMGQGPTRGSQPHLWVRGSGLHLWVTASLVGRSSACRSVRGSIRIFLYGPTSTCGAALWGRAPLMGQSSTYGSEPLLWVAAPLVGQSPTYESVCVGHSCTCGSQLHLWVSPWVQPCSPVGPHPLVGQRYGAELHLWVRAPLIVQGSTCGSVRGSVFSFMGPHPLVGQRCGAEPWSVAMGQGPTCGAEPHLWVRASHTCGSEPHLWVTVPLMGQSVWGGTVRQSHGESLWGRAMGQGPTYGAQLHILMGHSLTYGSVCRGRRCGAASWSVAMGQSYGAGPHLWV